MLLVKFKEEFRETLKGEYPTTEIDSFFFILTAEFLQTSRLDLALSPNRELSPAEEEKFREALSRLNNHEPIQYITGSTEFYGLQFKVNPDVLIPRPETEELLQWILQDTADHSKELKILDIGTGSGCIPITLASYLQNASVQAIDISEKALEIAKENAVSNGVQVSFSRQDILETANLSEKYDIIISNPPYVRELEKKEMHKNVLNYEPHLALYVKDSDPLLFYRKITKLAEEGLKRSGRLYFEINQYLADETKELVERSGFRVEMRKDIYGNFRMLKGTREQESQLK